MDLERKERHLAKADRDIESARERIRQQESLIQKLENDGNDIGTPFELLRAMRELLNTMIEHRAVIVETIEGIKSGRL